MEMGVTHMMRYMDTSINLNYICFVKGPNIVFGLFYFAIKRREEMSLLIYWMLLNLINAVTPGHISMVPATIVGVVVWIIHLGYHARR